LTVSSSARRTGGVGKTIPSFHMTPNFSFCFCSTGRHGIGRHRGSCSQGSNPTIVLEKVMISLSERAMGPLTLWTASWPANPLFALNVGKRPKDGRNVKMPVHAAGIRSEPPSYCYYISLRKLTVSS
jgi:hypothetical protein